MGRFQLAISVIMLSFRTRSKAHLLHHVPVFLQNIQMQATHIHVW